MKSEEKSAPQLEIAGDLSGVIVRPLVSEKSTMTEASGKYTFIVNPTATKIDIKNAVKQQYGVLPVSVNVIHVEGKRLRRGRTKGKRSDFKKAIVTVKTGDKLDVHAGL
ncbi:50S ribosomal protein L23 [Candidatus Nomurabacteria bacterium]|nr:50S ribosomal protein L23 [Candidatus Nomurabacteria bacterium]